MTIEHIRLSQTGRDQLITLKRRTGIAHWNVLCRWAFCRSLAEPAPPPAAKLVLDSNVEMTWRVFAGDLGDDVVGAGALPLPSGRLALDEETLASSSGSTCIAASATWSATHGSPTSRARQLGLG